MPIHRVPVYLWKDLGGHVVAVPIDANVLFDDVPYRFTLAPDFDSALRQVREGLRIHCDVMKKRGDEIEWPEPVEYERHDVTVEARPQYVFSGRPLLFEEKISFRLPIVVGREKNGLLRCFLPTLFRWFSCFETEDFRKLAGEKYRESLYDSSPEEILHDASPPEGRIQYVSVRTSEKPAKPEPRRYENLESVARPLLSELRRGGASAWCRDESVRKLASLLKDGVRNIALLGPEGVGRSTLLAAAVRQIERPRKDSPDEDAPKHRFWLTTAAHLVAGAKYLGQWQERLIDIIEELASFDGVLCVDDLAGLARVGGEAEESVAAFLAPYLEAGTIRMVGEITPWELDALQHRCGEFIDKFHLFPVEPLDAHDAAEALRRLGDSLVREKRRGFTIKDDVPGRLVRLYRRFCPYRPLPGGAADFLRQLLDRQFRSKETHLDDDRLLRAFLVETGLSEHLLRDEHRLTEDEVFGYFRDRIIGQDEACRVTARAIVNYKAAMNPPGRPIRSMLFCGPTGVGKTQLAKTLGEYLFENFRDDPSRRKKARVGNRLFRIDMSEYMHPWSATRLIEQDDGSPSPLIRFARRHPFSVVLLDEIEKAAPEVFDLLLGLLDEGRLTDRSGRTTFFQSTIIVMTSNLGTGFPATGFGGGRDAGHREASRFLKEVRSFFRPEFFNRIDDIVPFDALDRESCRKIVRGELERLALREGLAARNLRMVPDEDLVDRLVRQGFDARYGARPLQRLIESTVLPVLARKLFDPDSAGDDGIVLEEIR